MTSSPRRMLTTGEAAAHLGVKPATLYAYVSRGLLSSVRGADGRSSLFDPDELNQLSSGPRRSGAARAGPFIVRSQITEIRDGTLFFRGRDAIELARDEPTELTARWLWNATPDRSPFAGSRDAIEMAAGVAMSLPASVRTIDCIRTVVSVLSAADPLRADLRPGAVTATAAGMMAALVEALPARAAPPHDSAERRLSERLAPKLASTAPQKAAVTLDAALAVLADHELDAATLAVRVVASARAHPYAVVSAGLATLDSPTRTSATAALHRALVESEYEGSAPVLSRLLDEQRRLPGFGSPHYPDGDPRARLLLDTLASAPPDARRWDLVNEFLAATERGIPVPPNVDFALAALSYTAGMRADAGEAVIALSRIIGWIAHALEEYDEEPERFRIGRRT